MKQIITSLLENDLYKFNMGNVIFKNFNNYHNTWNFKCRNKDVHFTNEMVEEIKNDQEVSIEYMKVHEHEEMLQRIAYNEGESAGEKNLAYTIIKLREGKTIEELLSEGFSEETIRLAMSLK